MSSPCDCFGGVGHLPVHRCQVFWFVWHEKKEKKETEKREKVMRKSMSLKPEALDSVSLGMTLTISQYDSVSLEREQGWRSCESARLPPMWPGFDSRSRCHMWVEFVVGSCPCSEGFSPGSPVFLPPQKPTFPNFIWNHWSKSLSVEAPLQIPIYFIVSLPVTSSKRVKKWLSAGASFKGVINTQRSNPFSWDPKCALEVANNNYKTSTKGTIVSNREGA